MRAADCGSLAGNITKMADGDIGNGSDIRDLLDDALDPEARGEFNAIEQALAEIGGDDPCGGDDKSFEFSLSEAMELLPHHYVKDIEPSAFKGMAIVVTLEDLYEKLKTGRVEMSVSDLVFFIPASFVYDAAFTDKAPLVLPLASVVRAVGLDSLKDHMPRKTRYYEIDDLDNPFTEPDERDEDALGKPGAVIIEDDDDDDFDDEISAAVPVAEESSVEDSVEAEADIPEPKPEPEPEPVPGPVPEPAEDVPSVIEPEATEEPEPEPEPEPAEDVPSVIEPEATEEPEPETFVAEEPVLEEDVAEKAAAEAEKPADQDAGCIFDYPMEGVLAVVPSEYTLRSEAGETKIKLDVPDLFDQLKKGAVTVPLAMVSWAAPEGFIDAKAAEDAEANVTLSIKDILDSIGLAILKDHMPAEERDYSIERMADPFAEPKDRPRRIERSVAAVRKKADIPQIIEEKAEAGAVVESQGAVSAVHRVVSDDDDNELAYWEFPGNINLNVADTEELMLLRGVEQELAEEIIKFRESKGQFESVFELLDVHGLSDRAFRRMTGMAPNRRRYHRRKRLAWLLRMPADRITDLRLVAERVCDKRGFVGCVISDSDGLVLSEHGAAELSDGISAIVPRMLRRIRADMELIGAGRVETVSIAIDGTLYTVVAGGNAALTAVHAEDHVSETDLVFIKKLGNELAWLLSQRAYVGPSL